MEPGKPFGAWRQWVALVVLLLTAVDAAAVANNKLFKIDYLESALSYDGGPDGPARTGFVYFNITDVFDSVVNNDGSKASTTCEFFYPVASPPRSEDTGAGCNDISYTWWFSSYNNATDFGIAVNHRYGRAPGTPGYEVDGETKKNINKKNCPGLLQQCADAGDCYVRYEGGNPIQLPFYSFSN